VDWYEAVARLGGEEHKLHFFSMRSMASGDAFHCAYRHATQQALLDAHEKAFTYFGGVFRTLRYRQHEVGGEEDSARIPAHRDRAHDRLPLALGLSKRVLQSGERQREGRRGRRVGPLPAATISSRFQKLRIWISSMRGCWRTCIENRQRTISGRTMTVGEASEEERTVLLPLAEEGFPLEESIYPLIVDGKGRVRVKDELVFGASAGGLARGRLGRGRCWWRLLRQQAGRAASAMLWTRPRDSRTWSITWMCSNTSRARWRARSHWSSGAKRAAAGVSGTRLAAVGAARTAGVRHKTDDRFGAAGLANGWQKLIAAVEEALRWKCLTKPP